MRATSETTTGAPATGSPGADEATAGLPRLIVYEPHRLGFPPMRRYLRDLWAWRRFAIEVARAGIKAAHLDTALGRIWTVLNPLLLALVYMVLIGLLRGGERGQPDQLAILLSGLFLFYYTRNSMSFGAKSVIGGVSIILNTRMPRALLPLSSTYEALVVFLPTMVPYAVFHLVGGYPIGPELLALVPVLAIITVFNAGLGMGLAAVNVYFRDISSFLPYFLRIWLYLSPVLYRLDFVPERWQGVMLGINPMTAFLEAWHQALIDGRWPDAYLFFIQAGWAFGALAIGAVIFLLKEREFAVRL